MLNRGVRTKRRNNHRHFGRLRRQAVENAEVQATNKNTKMVYKTAGSEQGQCTLASLLPGAYDVSITAPGFNPYNRPNVSAGATEPRRLDVRLLEYQLGTLGDGREFRVQLTSPHPAQRRILEFLPY